MTNYYCKDLGLSLQPLFYCETLNETSWMFHKRNLSHCKTTKYDDCLYIDYLNTMPQYQRKGHATSLLKYMVDEIQRNFAMYQVTFIYLYRSANTTIYQQLGFQGDKQCTYNLPKYNTIAHRVRQKNRIRRYSHHQQQKRYSEFTPFNGLYCTNTGIYRNTCCVARCYTST
jgi:GNAT superfamily N-acetyltransferase